MSIPTLCIYSNQNPNELLYNKKVEKKHMDDIEKVINSPKWKYINTQDIRINYDSNTQFFCRIMTNYVYIVICDNSHNSKIYELIDEINNFVELKSFIDFNFYSENFEEMIQTFMNHTNSIGKIQGQIREVAETMTNNIEVTIKRQKEIDDLLKIAIIRERERLLLGKLKDPKNVAAMIVFFVMSLIGMVMLSISHSNTPKITMCDCCNFCHWDANYNNCT